MPVGTIKIISRKICKPLCCSNINTKSSGSLESKTSLESICTSKETISDFISNQSWISDSLSSKDNLKFEILAIDSNSNITDKTVINIEKLNICLKKYQLKLKKSFIEFLFNMDDSIRELHKEASIRVITKCVDLLINKNIRWSYEMIKWNYERKEIIEEFFNKSDVFDSLECDDSENSINSVKYNINNISNDEFSSGDNVLSTINFIEQNQMDREDSIEGKYDGKVIKSLDY